jgi:excisionase family DNA binding protein
MSEERLSAVRSERSPAPGTDAVYTVGQAATFFDVSPATVWRWIDAGKLPAYRVGGRKIRIRAEDLQEVVRPAREGREARAVAGSAVTPAPPDPEELARRRALVEEILARRRHRVIAPLTSADLVRKARRAERMADGRGR